MNEERLKVLKMLKEGRITMEEAELLLDALGEGGSRSEDPERGAGEKSRGSSEDRHAGEGGPRQGFEGWKGFPQGLFNFDWKLDPKIFQTGLRDAMKGFEQSMKDFAQDFGKQDFAGGFKEFFGRSSAQATKSFRAPGQGAVKVAINNRWGDMRINGGDSQEVTGTATVTAWGSDSEAAAEIAENVQISHYREGETIVIHSELPDSSGRGRYRVDLDLTVPRELALSVKGMSGDLAVSSMTMGVEAANLSGDVIIQGSSGVMSVESKSGDIELLGCEGEVRVHSLSGDIELERVSSVMVRAHAVSGDVLAEIRPDGPAEIDLQTTSGSVSLRVPADCGVEFAAETASGDISCLLPADISEKSTGRLVGTVNGGGAKARLQTKSGDISLKN
ncbi:MAG TPA: DUF4097 family beta strand repeat-containing protein [Spirochaetia bacterium]|nr:DUF4097 family beta strand repeat-containing protein [Spirochaetia bacterium]